MDERLAIASGTIGYNELEMPALTLCPGKAFKSVGPFFDETSFLDNAFGLEDIFDASTIKNLANETLYEIHEIRNVLHGRCYTIYFKSKVKARDFSKATFHFTRSHDFYLYFHSPGVELWLLFYTFPFSVTSEKILLSQDPSISGVDIHVAKSTSQKEGLKTCTNYTEIMWSNCLKNELEREFAKKLDCKISYFKYLNLSSMKDCTEQDNPKDIFISGSKIIESHWKNSEAEGCKKPCIETKYQTYVTSIPKNTGFLNDFDNLAQVLIYYDYLSVQESVEYFVYGGDRLVSAIGGVMGLCLGFSLLSILLCIIDTIQLKLD